ncbi:ApoD4 [Ramazzottius varieornatus]|uniref:ApoD4 n=1 Tax=Ramazzottius varieornatus TaxID=947166 RepID=A0A1D1VFD4_RAMVA|nr:ApoD4 [Ramazzottius varieornatus]
MYMPHYLDRSIFMVLTILMLRPGANGQIPQWGSCPTVETFQDLDIDRYMGRWFLVEAYVHFFELGLSCITADYFLSNFASSQATNPLVTVKNSGFSVMHKEEVASDGTAYLAEAGILSKWKLHFPNGTFFLSLLWDSLSITYV